MRINNVGSMGVNPYKREIGRQVETGKPTAKQDKVEISAAAKELQQAPQWVLDRQEKIRQLKEQVQNGTYQIDADAIAKSIMAFYFED